jgi:hypothetical protein
MEHAASAGQPVYTLRMSIHVLQRRDWNGEPVIVGDAFRVHKARAGRQLEAVCHVVTHALGWELRLEVEGSLQRSQVCRTQDEVLDMSEAWKAAMLAKGWL